jgi:hypothetical protein
MDKVTRWEWHGNSVVLILLCLTGILLPVAVVYFTTKLLKIETEVKDAADLSAFLEKRS